MRSDGNSDTVPRRLQFTHQDETVVGYIGWNSFSHEMDITNSIAHPDGDIRIFTADANGNVLIENIARISKGNLSIRGVAANNASINWTDTIFNGRASIGFPTSDVFLFSNTGIPSGTMRFQGEDSITATVPMLELNPNSGCHLFFDIDGEVARCASLANGGFEVNNTVTGAGFERVLTVGDVSTGSFTGTVTGVTALTQGTIEWMRITAADGNDLVTLSIGAAITGTSNTAQMTVTGLPVALRPTLVATVPCAVVNEAKFTNAIVKVEPTGIMEFYAPDNTGNTTNPFWTFIGFGVVGSKGLHEGWTITYRLN